MIRCMDRWVGLPLCAYLTVVERVWRVFARAPSEPPEKILFVKLIEMGSTVLACPAFREAQRMVGDDRIYILVFASNRGIIDALPFFRPENVIAIDDSGWCRFFVSLLRALWWCHRQRIDTAIDLEGLTRSSAVITYLSGARRRVGYHNFASEGPTRGRLFTHELNYNFQHHTSHMFLAMVHALDAPPDQVPMLKESVVPWDLRLPSFVPQEQEVAQVQRVLESRFGDLDGCPLVLLNPNCNDLLPLRRWPEERFVALGQRLLRETAAILVITGSDAERNKAERMAEAIGEPDRVISVAGCTTMRHLLTLYTLSNVLVSNDSGPCHFASLTPIHIIALFGPETPLLYGPLGSNVRTVSARLACSPCVNMLNHRFSPCTDNECMKQISVDEVFRAVIELVAQSGGDGNA